MLCCRRLSVTQPAQKSGGAQRSRRTGPVDTALVASLHWTLWRQPRWTLTSPWLPTATSARMTLHRRMNMPTLTMHIYRLENWTWFDAAIRYGKSLTNLYEASPSFRRGRAVSVAKKCYKSIVDGYTPGNSLFQAFFETNYINQLGLVCRRCNSPKFYLLLRLQITSKIIKVAIVIIFI